MEQPEQERIFLEWIDHHGAVLWKVARSFAEPDAQDELRQELMIAVWQSAPAYRGEASVSTYIYRVACHRAMTWVRGRRNYRKALGKFQREHAPEPQHPAGGEAERRLAHLYAALRTLDGVDRTLMLLHLDGAPYREIAEAIGITESNVGARLTRLRNRLADWIEKEGLADDAE